MWLKSSCMSCLNYFVSSSKSQLMNDFGCVGKLTTMGKGEKSNQLNFNNSNNKNSNFRFNLHIAKRTRLKTKKISFLSIMS